jgi:hypothetical protein
MQSAAERHRAAYREGGTAIIEFVMKRLFDPETRRFQNWIDDIARRNHILKADPKPLGFLHRGRHFRPSWLGRGNWGCKTVHDSLADEVQAMVDDKEKIDEDRQSVQVCLHALLTPCVTMDDIRDALPECVIAVSPEELHLTGYARSRAEAFTIADNPRALRLYGKVKPKLELYAAARFIY